MPILQNVAGPITAPCPQLNLNQNTDNAALVVYCNQYSTWLDETDIEREKKTVLQTMLRYFRTQAPLNPLSVLSLLRESTLITVSYTILAMGDLPDLLLLHHAIQQLTALRDQQQVLLADVLLNTQADLDFLLMSRIDEIRSLGAAILVCAIVFRVIYPVPLVVCLLGGLAAMAIVGAKEILLTCLDEELEAAASHLQPLSHILSINCHIPSRPYTDIPIIRRPSYTGCFRRACAATI